MSTKLLNADGSPGIFETGAKAVMTPQLGKRAETTTSHIAHSYAQVLPIYQTVDPTDW
jgi:hypothetical protein